jgi:hypothetical protein
MAVETVLYGVKVGDEDWQEAIITTDAYKVEPAKVWAEANGYDRLRVATIKLGKAPNFAKTINRK